MGPSTSWRRYCPWSLPSWMPNSQLRADCRDSSQNKTETLPDLARRAQVVPLKAHRLSGRTAPARSEARSDEPPGDAGGAAGRAYKRSCWSAASLSAA